MASFTCHYMSICITSNCTNNPCGLHVYFNLIKKKDLKIKNQLVLMELKIQVLRTSPGKLLYYLLGLSTVAYVSDICWGCYYWKLRMCWMLTCLAEPYNSTPQIQVGLRIFSLLGRESFEDLFSNWYKRKNFVVR